MNAKTAALSGVMVLFAGVLGAAAPAQALDINPLFASTFDCGCLPSDFPAVITLQGNAPAMAAITAATQQISSQFSNNVTSNILFYGVHAGTNSFLAASISGQTVYTYNQYATALGADAAAHPSNAILNSGVANLGVGNGANQPLIVVNTPDARVLGLGAGANGFNASAEFSATGVFVQTGGVADGIVLLNLDQPLDFTRPLPGFSDPPGPTYDAESAMEHEIDEVMGIGGAGSQLNDFNGDPNYAQADYGVNGPLLGVMDLYRYQAPGVGSFDPTTTELTGCPAGAGFTKTNLCNGLPSPYFSVDGGATSIDTFNQAFPEIGGDAGDWGLNLFAQCPGGGFGGTGDVQDAFTCNNQSPDVKLGTPSYKAFESIGYNGVPEPDAWALMLLGFGGLGAALRRRRAVAFVATA